MSAAFSEMKRKTSELTEHERAELALSLIDNLDGPSDPDVEEAWRVEIERRLGQINQGEVKLLEGSAVFARVRRRLG